MRKSFIAAGALVAAVALSASGASAAVTFDSATGAGFVGKGDVQLAFGWNDAKLQQQAENLRFTYEQTTRTTVMCEKEVTLGGPNNRETMILTKDHHRSSSIAGIVSYEARRNKQQHVTGFILDGYRSHTESGGTAACPNDNSGWHQVGETTSETLASNLMVHSIDGSAQLA